MVCVRARFGPGSTRSVIDKFKNAQFKLSHRPPGAPAAPTVPAKTGTADPASTTGHASRLAVHSASGPIPELTGFDPAAFGAGPVPGMRQGLFGSQTIAEGPLRAEKLSSARTFGPHASAFPGAGVGPSLGFEDTGKATYVHQHFATTMFTGDMSQSIVMHSRDYDTCARQHRPTLAQNAEYLVNRLEGAARNFLLGNFTPGTSS